MKICVLAFMLSLVISTISSANEVFVANFVPQPGVVSTATGTATFTLNDSNTAIAFDISINGVERTEIAAHIHAADGSIVFPLPLGLQKVGTWQDPGGLNIIALRLEQLFVLIHTEAFPLGEIRGNILMQSTPTSPSTWGSIKALYR